MPHVQHGWFEAPNDLDTVIWRYLTPAKFISVLDTRTLYFTRCDRLGDPLEGKLPAVNEDARRERLRTFTPELTDTQLDEQAAEMRSRWDWLRTTVGVSCWRLGADESMAMWKMYSDPAEGVAIRSTFRKLTEGLVTPERVYVGRVKYIDRRVEAIPEGNSYAPVLYKSKIYEFEQELRAVVSLQPKEVEAIFAKVPVTVPGVAVEFDLENVVNDVVISPTADSWFRETIERLIARYDLNFPVTHSLYAV